MAEGRYSIDVSPEEMLVEVRFASSVNFSLIEHVLIQLRDYIANGYRVKIIGYINKECNYLKAFTLALSLFGNDDKIFFINKARFNKAERRKSRMLVRELRSRGYSAKQISEELGVPLKTTYRWLTREAL
jgi:hypothetical protein